MRKVFFIGSSVAVAIGLVILFAEGDDADPSIVGVVLVVIGALVGGLMSATSRVREIWNSIRDGFRSGGPPRV